MAESGEEESRPPDQGKKMAVPLPTLRSSAAFMVFRSMVHKNARRGHQEREERRANSPRGILAARSKRRRRCAWLGDGGRWR